MGARGFIADSFEVLSPKTDSQHVLETVGQVGCVSTNTLYVPEVILLHKGQQPWDRPHPYRKPLTLQDRVATCKLPTGNGSWTLPAPGFAQQ